MSEVATTDCVLWDGYLMPNGYGHYKGEYIHRVAYREWRGEIPGGWHVHHKCHVRPCVNPDHLEVMPASKHNRIHPRFWTKASIQGRHNAQKTHCPQGHEYSESNTYRRASGHRTCRTCHLERHRLKYEANPDPARMRARKYRAANLERVRETNRRYYRRKVEQGG